MFVNLKKCLNLKRMFVDSKNSSYSDVFYIQDLINFGNSLYVLGLASSPWSMRFVFKVQNIPLRETMTSVSYSDKPIFYHVECIAITWILHPSSTRVRRKIIGNMVSHRVKIEDIHMSDIDQRVIFSSVATYGHICQLRQKAHQYGKRAFAIHYRHVPG